jgi:EEF1A lysine methyltransferase 4
LRQIQILFQDNSFDTVIEKATLDALLVNEKSAWTISDEGSAKIASCLSEVSRVLKNEAGRFLSFTFSPPHLRVPLFAKDSYRWNIEHRVTGFISSGH